MPRLEELERWLSFLCLPLINGQCIDLSSTIFFQGESPNISGLLLQAAMLSKQEEHLHSDQLCC